MTVATETWYTGYDPYTLEPVFSAKTQKEKLAQRQFFFWYKPEERRGIEQSLRRIGRADLIKKLYDGNSRTATYRQEEPRDVRGRDSHHNTSSGGYRRQHQQNQSKYPSRGKKR